MLRRVAPSLVLVPLLSLACVAPTGDETEPIADQREAEQITNARNCRVVIAGGTTAALAAALASATEGVNTCLLEPTDWIGGQLTASGVPAIDEAWLKVKDASGAVVYDIAGLARDPRNMTPALRDMLAATGNPGKCWVSRYCFAPFPFLRDRLMSAEARQGKLFVFRNTVVKSVVADRAAKKIRSLTAIARTAKPGVTWGGYDVLPSDPQYGVRDWYSPADSTHFSKRTLSFDLEGAVFVDATEWGEVLALSKADYVQGIDKTDGSLDTVDTCGQATVFDLAEKLVGAPTDERGIPEGTAESRASYSLSTPSTKTEQQQWETVFRYRRIIAGGSDATVTVTVGDVTVQNWFPGNDYPFGYLFASKAKTAAEVDSGNWVGGIDYATLAGAERHALGWHRWFAEKGASLPTPRHVQLARDVFGTAHGLAKMPYIRDTRRSVGFDVDARGVPLLDRSFVMKMSDIGGPVTQKTGKRFSDRVAIGVYTADVHPIRGCSMPAHTTTEWHSGRADQPTVLPGFIPFRALTNRTYLNLLVAGKTMAQSFMVNAALRLHPIEWSSGTAAGVAAAFMANEGRNSAQVYGRLPDLQTKVRAYTPIEWTIGGAPLPAKGESTSF